MAGHGLNVNALVTDRQTAFLAQKLAGIRLPYPPKGAPCRALLLEIQNHVIGISDQRRKAKLSSVKLKPERRASSPKSRSTSASYEGLAIFTDGACVPNPGPGGWAWVAYRDGVEIEHGFGGDPRTTNNAMELIGLLGALEWILANHPRQAVTVYTDSTYTRDCATTWVDGWIKRGWRRKGNKAIENLDIIKAIFATKIQLPAVKIEWVRGHAGERGNERADELAELGRLGAVSGVAA